MQPEAKRGRILDPIPLVRHRSAERGGRHVTTSDLRRQAAERSRGSSRGHQSHQSGATSRGGPEQSRKRRSEKTLQRDRERKKSRSRQPNRSSANRSSSVDPGFIPHAHYHNSYQSDVASYRYGIQSHSSEAPLFDHQRSPSGAPPFDYNRLSGGDWYGNDRGDYDHSRQDYQPSEPVFKHPGNYFPPGKYYSAREPMVATYKHGLPSAEEPFDRQRDANRHGFMGSDGACDFGQYQNLDAEEPRSRGRTRDRRASSMDNGPRGHQSRSRSARVRSPRGRAPGGQAPRDRSPKTSKKSEPPCRPRQIAPDYDRIYAMRRALRPISQFPKKAFQSAIKMERPLTEKQNLLNNIMEALDYRPQKGESWDYAKFRVLDAEREMAEYHEEHLNEERKKFRAVVKARLIQENPGCDQPGYRRRSRSRSRSISPNKRFKDIFEF
ncbi:hypothetical protein B9Z55_026433 [Caenorhabditis nigoni]|uniref:Uncharacterized protein n=1 Tax=Caenorhabditis nigoni TaxID=1611254 RepID=A0A2G5T3D0_9PELO|nr:hypothetical protein B9Z55_026433 [Caenorhabditis nigoni]